MVTSVVCVQARFEVPCLLDWNVLKQTLLPPTARSSLVIGADYCKLLLHPIFGACCHCRHIGGLASVISNGHQENAMLWRDFGEQDGTVPYWLGLPFMIKKFFYSATEYKPGTCLRSSSQLHICAHPN